MIRCAARRISLTAAVLAASVPAIAPAMADPPEVPRARDGNIAIAQELCAAREAGTVEAYDLFIARHPDHPLAEVARAERERLVRRR